MAKHQRTKSCIEKYNNAVYEKYKKNNATSSTTTTTTTVQNTTTVLYEGGRSTPMVEYNPMAFEESSAEDEEPMNILGMSSVEVSQSRRSVYGVSEFNEYFMDFS